MKFLPAKLERKFRRLKKHSRSSLTRKLDVMHESARKKVIEENCDAYKNQKQSEYECRKRPTKFPGGTRETFLSEGSFHQAVGRVLLVAEFFAMMPVKGVTAKHPGDLSFSWRNVRTCFCLVFIASSLANFGLSLFKVLNNPISFNSVKPIIFRGSVLLVLIVALRLAQQWPTLMMYWHEVEQGLPQYPSQVGKSQMGHTIRMVMLVGMMLSFAEHLLSMISAIHYARYCNSTSDPIKNYFLRTNDEIFYVTSYSTALALWGKFQNVYSTFIWNYMDMFVMIVSIGLAAKFRQLNNDLRNFKGMHMAPSYWSERRIQYRNICILCDKMDDAISLITMVSFSNNLYFICVQLLRSLNTMPSVAHAVYFYFSLIFLIGRTLAVSLYSASVHDESRLTLRYLRCVPKDSWCPEVKRFSEEVINDEVALSGMKFFHLTRKLVLSVAGTIVTYELVLIQFHEDNDLWDCNQSYYS
ncbi:gustatory receptor for sugar taste 64f isoform X1 [Drosophila miranda]|uniref:gustatory receptor for sugar taste 64f isoform X1 n=1 Tax=Drosophila miranda TaxID=7229 RepID=UPI0007E6185A|nr:gustatory receptor for sugar taste 64f isoform X1 [Drosophila miranda]